RLFLMFMGPWDQGGPWSPTGIGGVFRFLNRVWTLALDPSGREPGDPEAGHLPVGETEAAAEAAIRGAAHRTLRDVTEDYEGFRFNTMVAKLMELSNTLFRYRGTPIADRPAWDEAIRLLLLMLAPAAPHISEELWSRRLVAAGEPWASIHSASWPAVDEAATAISVREIPVQVNGKLRDKVTVPADATDADIEATVLASPKIASFLDGRAPDRVILAGGGRLVNLVVR
nr:class I tRNA ligase family protein [Chloroflexota bacterium]